MSASKVAKPLLLTTPYHDALTDSPTDEHLMASLALESLPGKEDEEAWMNRTACSIRSSRHQECLGSPGIPAVSSSTKTHSSALLDDVKTIPFVAIRSRSRRKAAVHMAERRKNPLSVENRP
jgi:hypothetical protein